MISTRNGLGWAPGFVYLYHRKFLERLRITPQFVSSEENCSTLREHLAPCFQFHWIHGRAFWSRYLILFRKPVWCVPCRFREFCVSIHVASIIFILNIPVIGRHFHLYLSGEKKITVLKTEFLYQLLPVKWNLLGKRHQLVISISTIIVYLSTLISPLGEKNLLFCAIFKIWKQNFPLKRAIFDVFLPDACQLPSGWKVHATERDIFFSQIEANLP